jgi:hypothetical protein
MVELDVDLQHGNRDSVERLLLVWECIGRISIADDEVLAFCESAAIDADEVRFELKMRSS